MKIHKIEAGNFIADGGAMFGVVPKRVWKKRYPCNDENFCTLNMRCLLVKTENKLILVDTGSGNKQLDYLKYYGIKEVVDFETELNRLGYSCSEVTDVVLTHLHFDHCGGCTKYNDDRTAIELTFPNAYYWVGERQWNNFLKPNVREGDSYFKENMLPIEKAGKLKLVTENIWLNNTVELRLYNGHTVGQIVPYFYQEDKTFLFPGDVVPMMAALPIAWVSAYDTFPITSMEDKEILLKEAAEKKQILVFEHDAYHECCTVTEVNGKYRVDTEFNIEDI